MEETNNTPVEQEIEQQPTVDPNAQTIEQPSETVENDVGGAEQPAEVSRNNWNNGRRRIEHRQSLKNRIAELEERLSRYEGKNDDYSRFQSEQLQDRIADMRAMDADAQATEFANRAEQWFGTETDKFMQDTYRYAAYVNQNEPDLLRYSQREYGPILLHEWYKRMDNPTLRQQWLGMTTYEKGAVLNNFYQQIAQIVAQYSSPQQQRQQPRQNIPVPNGGRQSSASTPTDDFGIALGDALNRHR